MNGDDDMPEPLAAAAVRGAAFPAGAERGPRQSEPDIRDLLGQAELTTTNLYADSVSNSRKIIGRLDHMGKLENHSKQEGLTEGEVR